MKKLVLVFLLLLCSLSVSNFAIAEEEMFQKAEVVVENPIMNDVQLQKKVSEIGLKLLNSNKIDVRMMFVYKSKNSIINLEPGLTKRQIIAYEKDIQFASDDDEIASFLAREICKTAESYSGIFKGLLTSVQVKCAPKKYELFFDRRAVDFMVVAGYNPIALITYLNKAKPQKRFDIISRTNLTSKRLAHIYEYIYEKYPYYLAKNTYITNESYQNFLLTSMENRKKLQEKIETGSTKDVDYE